jgi:hypothetical protein
MKNEKNQKIAPRCWAGISTRGPALLAWPHGTAAQPAHASRCFAHVFSAVTAGWPHARRRGQRSFAGGLGVARLAGTPRGSGGSGAEKTAWRDGILWRRQSSGGRGGRR